MLELEGNAATTLDLALTQPVEQRRRVTLGALRRSSHHVFTGPFPAEAWQWHRLVPRAASALAGRCTLAVPAGRSHVYLRVRQRNGHMAWGSPVFINHR